MVLKKLGTMPDTEYFPLRKKTTKEKVTKNRIKDDMKGIHILIFDMVLILYSILKFFLRAYASLNTLRYFYEKQVLIVANKLNVLIINRYLLYML